MLGTQLFPFIPEQPGTSTEEHGVAEKNNFLI
jgi:hypothetical protein